MKISKTLFIYFIILSMLFTVSCQNSSEDLTDSKECAIYPALIAEFEESHTAGEFEITVNSINLNYTESKIILTGNNPTDKVASFDTSFDIEKLDDGNWSSCKVTDPEFAENESGILEHSSSKVTYGLGNNFDLKEVGTYRFKTNVYYDALESRVKNELSIEFKIVYDTISPSINSYEISNGSALFNISWNNNSDNYIYLTNSYYVEALNSGKWVECEKIHYNQEPAVFSVAPGGNAEELYKIDEMFELTYYGNYRVYIEYAIGTGENTQMRCALIEFYIPYEIEVAA